MYAVFTCHFISNTKCFHIHIGPSSSLSQVGPLINLNPETDPPCELLFAGPPLEQDMANPLRSLNGMPHEMAFSLRSFPDWLTLGGNRSLVIEREEFLLSEAENRAIRERDEREGLSYMQLNLPGHDPKAIEFLGNGNGTGGIFSRAILVLWPRINRVRVAAQVTGDTGTFEFDSDDGDY